ncbi:MAG: ferredoxin [Gammaproteobacteria bacterium]|jgi:ferredoxin
MSNQNARTEAYKAYDALEPKPTGIINYQSNGHVIVIGTSDNIATSQSFIKQCQLTSNCLVSVKADISVDGYLGHFNIEHKDEFGNPVSVKADAIFDLYDAPLIQSEWLPPGYYRRPKDDLDLAELAEELQNLSGEFEKPKYFEYDSSICAHSANGKINCTRCIDACPAEAIISIGDQIEVNPYLCQGGGGCSTACPSGAIQYRYPSARDNGRRIRILLETYRERGGANPAIWFHDSHQEFDSLEDHILLVEVEEIASVGPELCMAALAHGAEQVVLMLAKDTAGRSVKALQSQIGWLNQVAGAIGFDASVIQLTSNPELVSGLNKILPIKPAEIDFPEAKREAFYQAVDFLIAQNSDIIAEVELDQAAPFGRVSIDSEACTLCMACISACPGKALQDGSNRGIPAVFLVESKCLQCGSCVQTCPEQAMTLTARFILDREQRDKEQELNRDSVFECTQCGKPFAPESVIGKMQEKLKDHYMFNNERALARLTMCDNCRVADIVQDSDALTGQFDPLTHKKH